MSEIYRYVLIIEHKAEQPLVMEQILSKGTYDEVRKLMKWLDDTYEDYEELLK